VTKDEWKKVKDDLDFFYKTVYLRVDGYEVALILVRVSQYKNAIDIYINGYFRGEWLTKDCEERRRFVPYRMCYLYDKKFRDSMKSKRKMAIAKSMNLDPFIQYKAYRSHWHSFAALKKHLIANNKQIELSSQEAHKIAKDRQQAESNHTHGENSVGAG
jgi:hypothetical protein